MLGKFERWIANFGLILAGVLMWVLPIYSIASLILYNITVGYYPWHLLCYFVLVLGAAVCGALGSICFKIALYKGIKMNIDKIEACLIYFPRAQYLLSLKNEDKELIEKIFKLVKNNPKLKNLSILNKENKNEH